MQVKSVINRLHICTALHGSMFFIVWTCQVKKPKWWSCEAQINNNKIHTFTGDVWSMLAATVFWKWHHYLTITAIKLLWHKVFSSASSCIQVRQVHMKLTDIWTLSCRQDHLIHKYPLYFIDFSECMVSSHLPISASPRTCSLKCVQFKRLPSPCWYHSWRTA